MPRRLSPTSHTQDPVNGSPLFPCLGHLHHQPFEQALEFHPRKRSDNLERKAAPSRLLNGLAAVNLRQRLQSQSDKYTDHPDDYLYERLDAKGFMGLERLRRFADHLLYMHSIFYVSYVLFPSFPGNPPRPPRLASFSHAIEMYLPLDHRSRI